MKQSIMLNVDAYKVGMWCMYPKKTTIVYRRGGLYDETVFFGLQAFIQEYLLEPITQEQIDFADSIWTANGQYFNKKGWEYILNEHDGYLPVVIKAVEEGSVVPVLNVLATIENTDPECYWLTTWIETALLRAIWYPTTVATQGYSIKKVIKQYLDKTADNSASLSYRLHDFGARGVSSYESSMIGGVAHLVNFEGTDTIAGVIAAKMYYDCDMAGRSVPASEHSISCAYGRD
jgi:nicotinamide phosphoribosyltransferase